ncbi:hypothetical protein PVK06_007898 [Gossypium arboreum]|uniref:Glycine--tRNA ligase n=1 Tax=Gossypium arboreum TaxID=29729 RepID=A0ABR0QJF1_GOSAR|nr:hypothetical protein PVK06_007898 [Gossypium arboreum]
MDRSEKHLSQKDLKGCWIELKSFWAAQGLGCNIDLRCYNQPREYVVTEEGRVMTSRPVSLQNLFLASIFDVETLVSWCYDVGISFGPNKHL